MRDPKAASWVQFCRNFDGPEVFGGLGVIGGLGGAVIGLFAAFISDLTGIVGPAGLKEVGGDGDWIGWFVFVGAVPGVLAMLLVCMTWIVGAVRWPDLEFDGEGQRLAVQAWYKLDEGDRETAKPALDALVSTHPDDPTYYRCLNVWSETLKVLEKARAQRTQDAGNPKLDDAEATLQALRKVYTDGDAVDS